MVSPLLEYIKVNFILLTCYKISCFIVVHVYVLYAINSGIILVSFKKG